MKTQNKDEKSGFLATLGPGLITGASDDDPSGIATYSQVGAQFGYTFLWTMLFSFPLMSGIQEASADIGRVTGRGIAGNLRATYPRWVTILMVGILVIANTINLGADIGAMGDAVSLVIGGPKLIWAAVLAIGSLLLQVFVPYTKYVAVLKWLTLSIFAYVATVFLVKVSWADALRNTFLPSIRFDANHITTLVAVLGTTISPYLFFWQASEEAEEVEVNPDEKPLKKHPEQAPYQIKRIAKDTFVGMGVSNLVAFFIMLSVAATLHAKGVTNIESSAQAAQALQPVAGKFAFLLFTTGIVGTGLLAIPILAGSAAYAVGEALEWPCSLERPPLQAKGFYTILSIAILMGLGMNLAHVNTIRALYWAAVLNGLAAGPVMVLTMLMGTNPKVMGQITLKKRAVYLGWLATGVMIVASILMVAFWGK